MPRFFRHAALGVAFAGLVAVSPAAAQAGLTTLRCDVRPSDLNPTGVPRFYRLTSEAFSYWDDTRQEWVGGRCEAAAWVDGQPYEGPVCNHSPGQYLVIFHDFSAGGAYPANEISINRQTGAFSRWAGSFGPGRRGEGGSCAPSQGPTAAATRF